MIDEHRDTRLTQLLEELGPADPPPGFTRHVMARIDAAGGGITGRIIAFSKGGVAMTRKAMWGLATAAAAVLVVFVIKGFPTVDHGTEGTIGAAKKYQAPQIAESACTVFIMGPCNATSGAGCRGNRITHIDSFAFLSHQSGKLLSDGLVMFCLLQALKRADYCWPIRFCEKCFFRWSNQTFNGLTGQCLHV